MITGKKVGVISLGCDKNRVDTEKMLALLKTNHQIESEIENAQIIIINTCAFLSSAREEAITEILSVATLKESGNLEKLIITGCLPQKFGEQIFEELVEVDAMMGVSDYDKIQSVINAIYKGERVNAVGSPKLDCLKDRVKTTNGYAYLKIADGCNNHCTYCLIPSIRGKFRSTPIDCLIEETKALGEVNELILVAQDLTRYGEDLGDTDICQLIEKLSKIESVKSIRLLYCYPERITDKLISVIKNNDKVVKYIDVPLQHASDKILKLMNRKGSFNQYISLIEKLKKEIPNIAIRSTFITGFPQERQEDFDILIDFLQRAKLFNAGFFAFSREEGTPAYKLLGQIPKGEKTKRVKKLYAVQKKIVKQNLKSFVGKTLSVSVGGFDENSLVYYGRAYFNAPDIDGKVFFFADKELFVGDTVEVYIKKAQDYDLYGELV